MSNRDDPSQSPEESHEQAQDFDNGANDLWSLYIKEAQNCDESRIKSLQDDMGSVLVFVRTCFPSYQPSERVDIIHSRLVYSLLFSQRSSS